MGKQRCPACGKRQVTPWKQHMLICHACKGRFDPNDMDEGGDYDDRRVDERLIREECGDPSDHGIRMAERLKGGL